MLVALSLLRFQNVDAIPIGVRGSSGKKIAVSGYSSLSEVLANSSNFAKFLEKPCERFSVKLSTIGAEDDLENLLKTINKTGFGFACIEEHVGQITCGLVSLRDLLTLYGRSVFSSELSVGDVASSPVFSLPGDTTLKSTLGEMLKKGIRRVFVYGTDKEVTDRAIIQHIFSVSRLSEASSKPHNLLDTPIDNIQGSHPKMISVESSLKEGAELMTQTTDGCLVCKKGVVTPWDLVIKPWQLGKLAISQSRQDRG